MYEGQIAETVFFRGHKDDQVIAYYARPLGAGPYPGVVVLHHMPGWDEWNREVARKLAHHGYAAILPNLHYREAPGASPDDASAKVRAMGLTPDDQMVGDVEGAAAFLRAQTYANAKVGVMGFCSGGRQTYLAACRIPSLDAAVDCWGGRVVAKPEELTPRQPVAPVTLTKDINCPVLGLFGNEDANPTPDDVDKTEAALKLHGKVYEFHRYDNAGHGFFATDRPNYRQHAAVDGWLHVFAWFGKYLSA